METAALEMQLGPWHSVLSLPWRHTVGDKPGWAVPLAGCSGRGTEILDGDRSPWQEGRLPDVHVEGLAGACEVPRAILQHFWLLRPLAAFGDVAGHGCWLGEGEWLGVYSSHCWGYTRPM